MANSNGWGDGAANNSIGWGQGANNNIGWGDSHAKSWAGLTDIVGLTTDADAQAFLTASAITGATQQAAIDNLVKGLKSDGLWSKMKAVYPFVTDNRNLLSYTEDFSNAYWGKQDVTVVSNSTNAPNSTLTADTIIDNTVNSYHGIIMTDNISATTGITYTSSIYAKYNGRNIQLTYDTLQFGSTQYANFDLQNGVLGNVSGGTATITSVGNGWYRCTFSCVSVTTATNNRIYTLLINSLTATRAQSFIGNGVSGAFIWGIQLELGSTATTYQPIATTQQAYIANQFKYNLKDPRDLDAAFRLVFNGGWTHSNLGAQANGTNGYADTKLNSFTNLTGTSVHLSYYQRNEANGYQVGCSQLDYSKRFAISPIGSDDYIQIGNSAVNTPKTTTRAYYIGTRNTASVKLYKSNATIITSSNSGILPSINIFLNANNQDSTVNNYSSGQTAFASIGDGLSDTEAANLYTRVQAFQTSLSRQV